MTHSFRIVTALAIAVAVGALAWTHEALAVKTQGKSRLAQTKYLMRGISQAHCAGIGGLLKESGPADDKAWDTLLCHANCLNELSYVLMDDGRCPDADWAGAAKSLREATAAVAEAAGKKDLDATRTAFQSVTASCGACHKVHKGK